MWCHWWRQFYRIMTNLGIQWTVDAKQMFRPESPILQWRHNERDGVSNLDRLLKNLFGRRSKKTSKLRVTGLCEGNSPVTVEFPAQRASNSENVSIWWRHYEHCAINIDNILTIWRRCLPTNIAVVHIGHSFQESRPVRWGKPTPQAHGGHRNINMSSYSIAKEKAVSPPCFMVIIGMPYVTRRNLFLHNCLGDVIGSLTVSMV